MPPNHVMKAVSVPKLRSGTPWPGPCAPRASPASTPCPMFPPCPGSPRWPNECPANPITKEIPVKAKPMMNTAR